MVKKKSVGMFNFFELDWILFFFGLEGFWGQPQEPNLPSPRATMLALRLYCSTAALTSSQKVVSPLKTG